MSLLVLLSTAPTRFMDVCRIGAVWVLLLNVYSRGKKTNCFLLSRKAIFDTPEDDPNYNPLPEERPGGFAWGEGQRLGG